MEEKYQNPEFKEQMCSVVSSSVRDFIEGISKVAKSNRDVINAMAIFNIAVIKFAANDPSKEDITLECLMQVMKDKQFF